MSRVTKIAKLRTGCGIDRWHPRHFGLLPADVAWLLAIRNACERLRRRPTQVRLVMPFLAGKEDGAPRTLVLLYTLVRA